MSGEGMTAGSADGGLTRVLRTDADRAVQRRSEEFDSRLASAGGRLVLFGAGRLGQYALAGLRAAGVEPLAFADNAPATWSSSLEAIPVLSPSDAVGRFRGRALFVTTVYTSGPVRRQLAGLGLPFVTFPALAYRFAPTLLPHGALDLPHATVREAEEVRRAAAVWADEESRTEYVAQLSFRMDLDSDSLPPHLPPRETYFPADLVALREDETFVDCGAYDGDTVAAFLAHRPAFTGRIVAFEPDPATFGRLTTYLDRLTAGGFHGRAEARPFAVGETRGRIRFDATGTAASSVGTGTAEVECAPLDELLAGEKPTYIKMDLEGAELSALRGARGLLMDAAPVLAICLYHRPEDLWRIPLFLADLPVGYRLFLRRYSDDCWEQICYAIPKGRMKDAP
jgi:FkbM family methyltransferase